MPKLKLKQTAREIVLALRAAQQQAIRTGRETAVEVDLSRHLLNGPGQSLLLDPRFDLSLTAATPEGEDAFARRIAFFPDGTSTGGRLQLSYGGTRYDVTVDWALGRAFLAHE
jgi:general secretion pathway protein H